MNSAADAFMGIFGMKRVKPKRCRICRCQYVPTRAMQPTCPSYDCQVEYAMNHREKAIEQHAREKRKELREAKLKAKTRAEWLKEAQSAVNAFIRERDKNEPCISCGRHHQGQYHAGHYLSVGARPALRFCEINIHKQCAPCNNHLSGNAVAYRIGLIAKIGAASVGWLEGPHEPKKYTVEDAKAIKAEYAAKLKELKRSSDSEGTL